jgi:hypothetical protein
MIDGNCGQGINEAMMDLDDNDNTQGNEFLLRITYNEIFGNYPNQAEVNILKANRQIKIECIKDDISVLADWYINSNLVEEAVNDLILEINENSETNLEIKADRLGLLNNKFVILSVKLIDFNIGEEILNSLSSLKPNYEEVLSTKRNEFNELLDPYNQYIEENGIDRFLIAGSNDEYASEGLSNFFLNVQEKSYYTGEFDLILYDLIQKDLEVIHFYDLISKITFLINNKNEENQETWLRFVQIISENIEQPEDPFNFNFEEYQTSLFELVESKLNEFKISE